MYQRLLGRIVTSPPAFVLGAFAELSAFLASRAQARRQSRSGALRRP